MRSSLVFALAVAPASCSLLMGDLPDPLDGGATTGPAGDTGLAAAGAAIEGGGSPWGSAGATGATTPHGSTSAGTGGQVSSGESVGGSGGDRDDADGEHGN